MDFAAVDAFRIHEEAFKRHTDELEKIRDGYLELLRERGPLYQEQEKVWTGNEEVVVIRPYLYTPPGSLPCWAYRVENIDGEWLSYVESKLRKA